MDTFLVAGKKARELREHEIDKKDRPGFEKAKADNWSEHLRHEAARVAPPQEAATIDRSEILPAPS
eukprot:5497971-Alexandrium_andersonii.AAC.1